MGGELMMMCNEEIVDGGEEQMVVGGELATPFIVLLEIFPVSKTNTQLSQPKISQVSSFSIPFYILEGD